MEEIKLGVQVRTETGRRKAKAMRRDNFVPGIVYGGKKATTSIKVNRRDYDKIVRQHRGQNVVFHINLFEGDKKLRDYTAIIKEAQHDPVTFALLHLDFLRISLTEEIEVKVSIETKGEAIGVKKDGGSLDQAIWELDIVCLPTNIPEKIEIDVTNLNIGDAIHVKDVKLPEGVKTKHDPESFIVSVVPPMKEESEVSPEEELTEPEVMKEKKAEGEEKDEEKAEGKAEEKKEDKSEEKSEGK